VGITSNPDAVLTAYAQSLIRFKARQLSRKPGFSRSDEEDLAQEMRHFLLGRAHRFDPARASVNTFAARVINCCVATILRRRRCQKRAPGYRAQSLEATAVELEGRSVPLRDVLAETDLPNRVSGESEGEAERRELAEAVRQLVAALPPHLREICERLADETLSSVARDLGLSRYEMKKLMASIRERFQAAGMDEF
jgi:RNA polymerase sigma factor (sigma-70 family)